MKRHKVEPHSLPPSALLCKYQDAGAYTDCFFTRVDRLVGLPEYLSAFYSTWLFGMERFILKWAASKPSTPEDVRLLSEGKAETFAAWSVEARRENELLMADFRGHTRSWLMCQPASDPAGTELFFGSAVVSAEERRELGQRRPDLYQVLMPVHRMYSVALLACAKMSLNKSNKRGE